jgi:Flp pilus assembly protein protease CpaA
MPFPFLPGGVLLAVAVLGGALTIFGLALRAMDHAVTASRSMLPGLVAGLGTWTGTRPASSAPTAATTMASSAAGPSAEIEIVELFDRRLPDERRGG